MFPPDNFYVSETGRLHKVMELNLDNGIKFNISKWQSIDFYPNSGQAKCWLITFEGDNFQKAYTHK